MLMYKYSLYNIVNGNKGSYSCDLLEDMIRYIINSYVIHYENWLAIKQQSSSMYDFKMNLMEILGPIELVDNELQADIPIQDLITYMQLYFDNHNK